MKYCAFNSPDVRTAIRLVTIIGILLAYSSSFASDHEPYDKDLVEALSALAPWLERNHPNHVSGTAASGSSSAPAETPTSTAKGSSSTSRSKDVGRDDEASKGFLEVLSAEMAETPSKPRPASASEPTLDKAISFLVDKLPSFSIRGSSQPPGWWKPILIRVFYSDVSFDKASSTLSFVVTIEAEGQGTERLPSSHSIRLDAVCPDAIRITEHPEGLPIADLWQLSLESSSEAKAFTVDGKASMTGSLGFSSKTDAQRVGRAIRDAAIALGAESCGY